LRTIGFWLLLLACVASGLWSKPQAEQQNIGTTEKDKKEHVAKKEVTGGFAGASGHQT
jgi:hypothetical protein